MNRIKNIIKDYIISGESIPDKDSVQKQIENFLDEVKKDKDVSGALLDIMCEDFNVVIDSDRVMDALKIFVDTKRALFSIVEDTILNSEHTILPELKRLLPTRNIEQDTNLFTMLYGDKNKLEERKYLYVFISFIFPIVDAILSNDEEFMPLIYPTHIITPAIIYKDSIIDTLLEVDEDGVNELLYEITGEFKDKLFSNVYKDTWLEIK